MEVNIQRSTPNFQRSNGGTSSLGRWVLSVGCWTFSDSVRAGCLPQAARLIISLASALLLLSTTLPAAAQDMEPRRWSHMPADVNFAGAGYAYTAADIFFDPVLELEDVSLDMQTVAAKYIRTFGLLDRSARVELAVPYQEAHWKGLLQGEPASTSRQGFADPVGRFAVNLVGGPPLKGTNFVSYRAAHPTETIVGAGLSVHAPLGEYFDDKLLNLGENRFTLRPELGVEHRRGKLLTELTGTVSFFTDNNDFWNGNRREQDPMYTLQGHLAYTFRPGLWVSGGIGYGTGGASTINGTPKDDRKGNLVTGCSVGLPVSRSVGVKLGYLNSRTQVDTGSDSDTVLIGASVLW
jgi:hypothetical protein